MLPLLAETSQQPSGREDASPERDVSLMINFLTNVKCYDVSHVVLY